MTIDWYTKGVLTVIAVALAAIAWQNAATPASALGRGCGEKMNPCYIQTGTGIMGGPIDVRIVDR
jgi:hypothetical protein